MGNRSKTLKCAAFVICLIVLVAFLFGCASHSAHESGTTDDADGVSDSESGEVLEDSSEANPQEDAMVPEAVDAIDIENVDMTYGTAMASDGEYLYFTYVSNGDEGGLYRTDRSLESPTMLDRGLFSDFYLQDGSLYYAERNDSLTSANGVVTYIGYYCLNTSDLTVSSISQEEYEEVKAAVDPAARFTLPEGVYYCAVVGDRAYFIQELGELEESSPSNPVKTPNYALAYCDEQGNVTQTDITWRHRDQLGLIFSYGDYVVYSRTCLAVTNPDADAYTFEESSGEVPCFYNTQTGDETAIVREHDYVGGIHVNGLGSVFVLDATSGYIRASASESQMEAGEYTEIESLSDPDATVLLETVIEGAEITEDLAKRDAEEQEAELEELRNEPYGPGTSTIYLKAPDDKSACYRLVRMDGSTEFQVLLGPGESISESFPCGRYTLKTAEGDEWISDEEAFGPNGDYDTTDVFRFEEGGSYEIGSGYSGDFTSDDAAGFTGN